MQILRDRVLTFSKDNAPAAHAAVGETVAFEMIDGWAGQIQREDQLVEGIDFDRCNPVTGPLYVDGAEPGDALGVDILSIDTADHGVVSTVPGMGPLWPSCDKRTHVVAISDGYASYKDIRWPIRPMIGTIGTAPDGAGLPSCFVFDGGGNMDSRRIVAGVTLWMPVRVRGGLLAMGDMHASMGDGEVVGTGIEVSGRAIVRLRLAKGFRLNWPVTETRHAWYVNTCGESCDQAIEYGYKEMQRLISQAYGWDMTDAAMFMSVQGFLESNQACLTPDEGGDTFRVGTPKLSSKRPLIG